MTEEIRLYCDGCTKYVLADLSTGAYPIGWFRTGMLLAPPDRPRHWCPTCCRAVPGGPETRKDWVPMTRSMLLKMGAAGADMFTVAGSAIEIDEHAEAALVMFVEEYLAEGPGPVEDGPLWRALEKAYRCGFVHAEHRARKRTETAKTSGTADSRPAGTSDEEKELESCSPAPAQGPEEAGTFHRWRCSACGGYGPNVARIEHAPACTEGIGQRRESAIDRYGEEPPPDIAAILEASEGLEITDAERQYGEKVARVLDLEHELAALRKVAEAAEAWWFRAQRSLAEETAIGQALKAWKRSANPKVGGA